MTASLLCVSRQRGNKPSLLKLMVYALTPPTMSLARRSSCIPSSPSMKTYGVVSPLLTLSPTLRPLHHLPHGCESCAKKGLNPRSVTIDCSLTEDKALRLAWGNQIKIKYCAWHVSRAWNSNISLIKSSTDAETKELQKRARDQMKENGKLPKELSDYRQRHHPHGVGSMNTICWRLAQPTEISVPEPLSRPTSRYSTSIHKLVEQTNVDLAVWAGYVAQERSI